MIFDDKPALLFVSIDQVAPNPNQPRSTFNEKTIRELADSILSHGVLEPLLVVRKGEGYQIVAGERRYRASLVAGLAEVPVIVIQGDDKSLLEIAIIENLQRQNLNAIEEAQAIQLLIETNHLTQDEVAKTLGRSRPAITNLLRILALPLDIQLLVQEGKLSQGHARALLTVKDPRQLYPIAMLTIKNHWSVHALLEYIEKQQAPKPKKPPKPKVSIEYHALVEDMERVFEMPIKASGNEHKGTLTLQYGSLEDLQRIYRLVERLKTPESDD